MQSTKIAFSYIVPTYNKLPQLKIALATLVANKKQNEEIVVIDGGSTDGTPAYLAECLQRGEIEQYISERDFGLGHAVNKGLLLARGEVMKTFNDDDEYFFDEIQKCKEFMLAHPEIDILGANGIQYDGKEYRREEDFMLWKNTPYHPFMILELALMLRRSSIPVFGLADTSFIFWDGEFTIRVTAGKKARVAWYTGITFKHMLNPKSISITKSETWRVESARIRRMYPGLYSRWKHHVPKPVREFLRWLKPKKTLVAPEQRTTPTFLF